MEKQRTAARTRVGSTAVSKCRREAYADIEPALLERFTQVPNQVLFRTDLSHGAKLVWMALAAHRWDGRSPYPSQARLARLLGMTRQTINGLVKELKLKGLVEVRGSNCRRTREYVLHPT